MGIKEDKKRSRFGGNSLYNLRHVELEIFAKYQCQASRAGGMGLTSGDGRYRGTKERVIHSARSNRWRTIKTDIILDRTASLTVDLFRVVEVEARPLLTEDCLGMSTRRQL